MNIDADARHHIVNALLVGVHLQQHAADLSAAADDIVGPLDARIQLAGAGNRPRHRQCRLQRQHRNVGRMGMRSENQRHENALARRRNPASAAAAASCRLLVRQNQRSLLRAVGGKLTRIAVGRIHTAQIDDFLSRPCRMKPLLHNRLHQAVRTGNQPIALTAARFDFKPHLPELADLLPYRRAGHAQLLAECLPGNALPAKQARQNLLRHIAVSSGMTGFLPAAKRRLLFSPFILTKKAIFCKA